MSCKTREGGKQATAKRISYGKILADGTFKPNLYYQSLPLSEKIALKIERSPQPSELERQLDKQKHRKAGRPKEPLQGWRRSYGDSYLLCQIAKHLKVTQLLKEYWPNCWDKLLSISIFMVLNHEDSLYLLQPWCRTHYLPAATGTSSGNLSKLLDTMEEDDRQKFLKDWASFRKGEDTYCVDGSSFSTMSQYLRGARWGVNKEHDLLEQINVLVAFGSDSHLPLYISSHRGNLPDVTTLEDFVHNMYGLDVRTTEFCFDRGYCSIKNITILVKKKHKFIMAVRNINVGYIKHIINSLKAEELINLDTYSEDCEMHAITKEFTWTYEVNSNDTKRVSTKLYAHIYYNPQMALDKQKHTYKLIKELQQELETKPVRSHLNNYEKYFHIDWGEQHPFKKPEYDGNGRKKKRSPVVPPLSFRLRPLKHDTLDQIKKGLFVLISNSQKDCREAHARYKKRDSVEKAFMNLKNRIGLRRLRSGQQTVVDSRIFLAFVSLIIISELERRLKEAHDPDKILRPYNMELLLKELSSIDQYHHSRKARHVTPITSKQRKIYELLKITPPVRTMTKAEQKTCKID